MLLNRKARMASKPRGPSLAPLQPPPAGIAGRTTTAFWQRLQRPIRYYKKSSVVPHNLCLVL